jgi:hypothetical protein
MRYVALIGLVVALAAAMPALADPVCSKLAWPLDKARALLNGATHTLGGGSTLTLSQDMAITLALQPGATVTLPHTPEKPLDPAKFSGFVTVILPAAGDYLVSLSSEGWIDAIQNNAEVASTAHTGDPDCRGLRKSVRFTLGAAPLTLEISNAPADHIVLAITAAAKP